MNTPTHLPSVSTTTPWSTVGILLPIFLLIMIILLFWKVKRKYHPVSNEPHIDTIDINENSSTNTTTVQK